MIIVVGHLQVDPDHRDRAIELSRSAVEAARKTPGCIDFAVSADPVNPSRVNISERWADRKALEDFRAGGPSGDLSDLIQGAEVAEYEV